ncbi:MAG: cysteine--tRNA ligase [Candidatus Micrarchaeia archaeon]
MILYNTLGNKKEIFKPIHDKSVGLYTCGPTAYFYAHIGNMKAYIDEDLLKRTLLYNGYKVKHVMNVTDVGHLKSDQESGEDKVRAEAMAEHKTMREIVDFYSNLFFSDLKKLNIIMPDIIMRASDAIEDILKLIDILDKKGYLYKTKEGIYFDTSKFKNYGALIGMSFEQLNKQLKAGARVERSTELKNITDFAVWRFAPEDEKEMVWESRFGRGFPGWHIECSAISMKNLGEHFDIHCGGIDHIPIHHTNEIAQSEAATDKKFVNYWFHVGFLTVNGSKMAKSLKNIYTLADLEKKGYSPLAYRFFIISGNYREEMNFTFEALNNAKNTLENIYLFINKLSTLSNAATNNDSKKFLENADTLKDEFFDHVNNNLDMPNALSTMFKLIKEVNTRKAEGKLDIKEAKHILKIMLEFDKIIGINMDNYIIKEELSNEVSELIRERDESRAKKDFKRADEIRNILNTKYNIIVEDTKEGTVWHKKFN